MPKDAWCMLAFFGGLGIMVMMIGLITPFRNLLDALAARLRRK